MEGDVKYTAYYFAGVDFPQENVAILRIRDYNDPLFEHEVKMSAEFFVNVDWYKLIELYKRHSLDFLLKDPVVAPVKK